MRTEHTVVAAQEDERENPPKPSLSRRLRLYEIPLLIALVLFWMMLWREVSLLSVVSGIAVAVLVVRVFYLPPVELAGRINLFWSFVTLGYVLWRIALGSIQVAWVAIRPWKAATPSVVKVQLVTHSDIILTLTSLALSVIPGSLVAEVDRFGSRLYLHAIDAPDEASCERLRQEIHRVERLLILSIGSKQEVAEVRNA